MKKFGVTLLIIIVSLAIGIGGTYYYMSNIETESVEVSNKSTKDESCKEVENLDIYSDVVQDNYSKLTEFYNGCTDTASIYLKDSKVTSDDIENIVAYRIVAYKYFNNTSAISESEWNEEVAKLFGDEYDYDPTSFDATNECINHLYNSSTKQYEYRDVQCGCTTGPNAFTLTYITKAELDDDTLYIYLKALFPDNEQFTSDGYVKYFSDYSKTNEVSLKYGSANTVSEAEPQDIASNIKQGGSYKITMKNVSGDDYYFVSSEKIS